MIYVCRHFWTEKELPFGEDEMSREHVPTGKHALFGSTSACKVMGRLEGFNCVGHKVKIFHLARVQFGKAYIMLYNLRC